MTINGPRWKYYHKGKLIKPVFWINCLLSRGEFFSLGPAEIKLLCFFSEILDYNTNSGRHLSSALTSAEIHGRVGTEAHTAHRKSKVQGKGVGMDK